ncbi:membrane-bound serine racemase VanT [Enterococcus gilvus]|uniref:Alanine racemase n=1 Tax=Enterococcus gilvus ATCC BAA-350 TaxID=1158614 RepID=R2XLJ3_9ENTE|nr:membrane-bound serine racemase VanT [Enterococcus gilvus]EOI55413.1 alanine racemase [Enterococcus gilvus ATCC BAA-350]EOW82044.1 alanine racemase [Enterococcus gilvus ATCC BAA-350]OJG43073.1 alanine racemase [Enterococcus gilvus]
MKKTNNGVTNFRMIAAFMVVAIHSFPFKSIAPQLDTLITLTLFRVAVPFFFMVTGFYVLGPFEKKQEYSERQRILQFLKKISKLYLLVNLLYLPLAIYSGFATFSMPLSKWLQLFLFEGFLYHLWYFPALILGVILTTYLIVRFSQKKVLLVTGLLYLIGLGGDSWSGIFKSIPLISEFYSLILNILGGTRNGVFFAPLFLALGAFLYQKQVTKRCKKTVNPFLLFVSVAALLLEGYLLHRFSTPHHDSMYLFLPLVMLSLFQMVLQWNPHKYVENGAPLSLGIYVMHPYIIAVLHVGASILPFINNSVVFFISVSVSTTVLVLILLELKNKVKKKCSVKKQVSYRASKSLSSESLVHNLKEIRGVIPADSKVMAVVKANAYGTDEAGFAKILEKNGVDFFCVATIDEGIQLRKAGIKGKILILGYTSPKRILEISEYSLIQSIISEEHAIALNREKVTINCHIKVDTGMHRLGVEPKMNRIKQIYQLPYLTVQGLFSHLGSSDELTSEAVERTEKQLFVYDWLVEELKEQGVQIGLTHIQSSYGILNYPTLHYDYVRAGVILYGFLSNPNDETKVKLDLKPTIAIKAQLVSKKIVLDNEYIGYGLNTKFSTPRKVGVVSVGYCDGIPRELSDVSFNLFLGNQKVPQIGRICMDMLLVDLTELGAVPIETELTVLADFETAATQTQTITNEVLSRLGNRLSVQSAGE